MNASSESGLCATVILWGIPSVYLQYHAEVTRDAAAPRRLRTDRRHANGGAGRHRRLDRLAVHAAVRLAGLLLGAARRHVARAMAHRGGRHAPRDGAPLPWRVARARDGLPCPQRV